MKNNQIARVAGFHDVLPQRFNSHKAVEAAITRQFERYGYAPIALPVVEYSELFMRKSGEDIVTRMYDFQHRGRRLCLRPEMTASVMRAYIEQMQDRLLPVRLYYSGPVFRSQQSSQALHAQFNQVGLELIGAHGPLADGEVIHTACSALDTVHLKNYHVIIGHVGILYAFLNSLAIDGQLRSFLLMNLNTLRERGRDYVAERLNELHPAFGMTANKQSQEQKLGTPTRSNKLVSLLRQMEADEARTLISEILDSLNIKLNDYRDPDQLVDRLLTKLRRGDQTAALHTALDFMSELVQMHGEPQEVIRECKNLMTSYGVTDTAVDYLVELLQHLSAFGLDQDRIKLDVGMSLGLQYYTGLVFEIIYDELHQVGQLCGGGRYDDLVALLGGSCSQPASGFSFNLESVCAALEVENRFPQRAKLIPQVLVVPADRQNASVAVNLAETLRSLDWQVELDVHPRTAVESIAYARYNSVPFVVLAGRSDSSITLADLRRDQELQLDRAGIIRALKSAFDESC